MTATQLKAVRKELNWTQFALARKARVSRFNIALFETNVRKFTFSEGNRITAAIKAAKEKANASDKKK